jgi:hypothetical protein
MIKRKLIFILIDIPFAFNNLWILHACLNLPLNTFSSSFLAEIQVCDGELNGID